MDLSILQSLIEPSSIFPITPDSAKHDPWRDTSRDITYLSSLLKGTRGSDARALKKEISESMKLWSDMSFILTTGDPSSDPTGSNAVAVTGSIFYDSINFIVVSQNHRQRKETTTNISKISCEPSDITRAPSITLPLNSVTYVSRKMILSLLIELHYSAPYPSKSISVTSSLLSNTFRLQNTSPDMKKYSSISSCDVAIQKSGHAS